MTSQPARNRGVTTVMAMALVAMVGLTAASMAGMFAADAKRTRTAPTDAQLRQLLIAGALASQAEGPNPGNVSMSSAVRIHPAPTGQFTLVGGGADPIIITAKIGAHTMTQAVTTAGANSKPGGILDARLEQGRPAR